MGDSAYKCRLILKCSPKPSWAILEYYYTCTQPSCCTGMTMRSVKRTSIKGPVRSVGTLPRSRNPTPNGYTCTHTWHVYWYCGLWIATSTRVRTRVLEYMCTRVYVQFAIPVREVLVPILPTRRPHPTQNLPSSCGENACWSDCRKTSKELNPGTRVHVFTCVRTKVVHVYVLEYWY